jgi:hypothetical protein
VIITATVDGIETTEARFISMSSRTFDRLKQAMDDAGLEILNAQVGAASGSIESQTGKLMKALKYTVTDDGSEKVTVTSGLLGHKAFYGGILNVGANAPDTPVKSYVRTVRGYSLREGRKKLSQGIGFVSGYERVIEIRARPFIQEPFEGLLDKLTRDIETAIKGEVAA